MFHFWVHMSHCRAIVPNQNLQTRDRKNSKRNLFSFVKQHYTCTDCTIVSEILAIRGFSQESGPGTLGMFCSCCFNQSRVSSIFSKSTSKAFVQLSHSVSKTSRQLYTEYNLGLNSRVIWRIDSPWQWSPRLLLSDVMHSVKKKDISTVQPTQLYTCPLWFQNSYLPSCDLKFYWPFVWIYYLFAYIKKITLPPVRASQIFKVLLLQVHGLQRPPSTAGLP